MLWFLGRLMRSTLFVTAFFAGVAATHIAAAAVYLWAGPWMALAVYLLAVSAFMAWIMP